MSDETVTRSARAAARAAGLKRYMGKPCHKGHTPERFVSGSQCCECHAERGIRYRADHPEKWKGYRAAFEAKHPGKPKAYAAAYYAENRESILQVQAEWRARNPDLVRALRAGYYAAKRKATPRWLTPEHREQILQFHREARLCTSATGI